MIPATVNTQAVCCRLSWSEWNGLGLSSFFFHSFCGKSICGSDNWQVPCLRLKLIAFNQEHFDASGQVSTETIEEFLKEQYVSATQLLVLSLFVQRLLYLFHQAPEPKMVRDVLTYQFFMHHAKANFLAGGTLVQGALRLCVLHLRRWLRLIWAECLVLVPRPVCHVFGHAFRLRDW